MIAKELHLLLLAIRDTSRDPVHSMIENGFVYEQIGRLLSEAKSKNFISFSENRFSVTNIGLIAMKRRDMGRNGWIAPKSDAYIEKIDQMEIYLPPRRTLSSLKVRSGS